MKLMEQTNSLYSKDKIIAANQFVKEKEYWMQKLSGELALSYFPYDYTGKTGTETSFNSAFFKLTGDIFSRLEKIAGDSNPKLHIILTAALTVLHYKYTGNMDITICSPIDSQGIEAEFTNTVLALRNRLNDDMTFKELLKKVGQGIIEAIKHQNYPIEALLDQLKVKFNDDDFTLFDTALLLENIHDRNYLGQTKTNIIFSFLRKSGCIEGVIEYNSHLYKKDTIRRIIKHFQYLLQTALPNLDIRLSAISLLTEQEKHQLIFDFNNTAADYPGSKTIHRLFEEQAEKTPEKMAVTEMETHQSMTYRELDRQSFQLARILTAGGAGPGSIIGLMTGRSAEMIVGILGILKAGGAFLPLEPNLPRERIRFMLEDSRANQVLTIRPLEHKIEFVNRKFYLDALTGNHNIPESKHTLLPNSNNNAANLAYIIYTSGSTGRPKGVMIDHRSLVNYVCWAIKTYVKNENVNFPLYTSIAFDLTITSIFSPLAAGQTIFVYEDEGSDGRFLIEKVVRNKDIGIAKLTPSHLKLIRDKKINSLFPAQQQGNDQSGVKRFIVGGENLETELAMDIYTNFDGNIDIYNEYGPTEATVGCMIYKFNPQYNKRKSVAIGIPADNAKIYILDRHYRPVPFGVTGELYISGDGLARGYLNSPELTAERFVENPFAAGEFMYRTGDLAVWLADGNIEFCGRCDHEVKIRGYRIHTTEVETRLLNHLNMEEAAVIARVHNNGSKYLCAYVVLRNGNDVSGLREYLSQTLPEYMIPDFFVPINEIPLTLNGKIDRKKLPEPESKLEKKLSYVPPGNRIEKKLVEIWSEVLGVDEDIIGIDNIFFELGGNSLNATGVISRINKEFNLNVTLIKIFEKPRIKDLAEFFKEAEIERFTSVFPVEKKDYYALSSPQKRLFFLQQMELNSTAYNVSIFRELEGEINRTKLKETFEKLIKRHDSLRTSFIIVKDTPVQEIHREVEFEIEYIDISDIEIKVNPDGKTHSTRVPIKNYIRPFDLAKAPLIRVSLISIDQSRHILIVDLHHIITDLITYNILINDFMFLYNDVRLPVLRLQYKDYAEWQKSEKVKQIIKRQEEFWLRELGGEIPVLNIPHDYPRPLIQSFEGNTIDFEISEAETRALNEMARLEEATLFMVLLAIFNIFLSKISGQEDIVIGTPNSSRRHSDLEKIIGMFTNTLVLRYHLPGNMTFNTFFKKLRERTLEALENRDYLFEDLVEKIGVKRDMSRNPLFDIMFVFYTNLASSGEIPEQEMKGLKIKPYPLDRWTSKFDLSLIAIEIGEKLYFSCEYSTKLFMKDTILRFINYFKKVTTSIINDPGKKVSEIEIISEDEKRRLLYEFNSIETDYRDDKTIHRLFEEQVEQKPDNIAMIGQSLRVKHSPVVQLSYRELNENSNRLAYRLREKGAGPDSIVGLMVERSLEMISGTLAIMKAGGGYLPIDPEYPGERKRYMLEDGEVRWMLINDDMEGFDDEIVNRLELIDLGQEESYKKKNGNLEYIGGGSGLVYVIYTSGSTGKPKGVMLEHRNLVNLLKFQFKYTNIDCSRILQFATISFDASFHEIFSAFLSGGLLCLVDKETRTDIPGLFKLIERNRIKMVFLPISFLKMIFEEEEYINLIPRCITHIQTSGDQAVISNNFKKYLKDRKIYLHNHYGPSETHVMTMVTIDPRGKITELPPIGKPLTNTTVYIVDKWGQLSPPGAAGEIRIGGVQVGRGYLNRPELTAEKFEQNKRKKMPGKKIHMLHRSHRPYRSHRSYIYRSGDLARWLSDGNIEFLGRIDFQVKIRGFRVEPGEIESRLLNYPGIKEAVVLAQKEKVDKYLCAYIVSDGEDVISQLREYLSRDLPDYMIPSYFVRLEQPPLTPNGKIDRKALPKPEIKAEQHYVAPGNETEAKLVDLWADVLNIRADVISIDSSFFQLGGHSLKAMILVSKMHKVFDVKVPLIDIFKIPTIKELANYIKEKSKEYYISVEPAEKKEYYLLSSTQKRLYILQQMNLDGTAYNMPEIIPLLAEPDLEKIEETFKKLIKRHDSLRTSFHLVDDTPAQVVHDEVEFHLELHDLKDSHHSQDFIKRFIRPFDLALTPLVRAGLIKEVDKRRVLLVDMHHIISDGVSLEILIKDFLWLYKGEDLLPLRLQYKDFSQWQNGEKEKENLKRQEEYWLKEFEGEIPVLDLATDYPRPEEQSFEGNTINFEIKDEETRGLQAVALSEGSTLFMVLLAIYNILMSKLSGQEDIVIGTYIAGRRHADLEKIIGMFVNTLSLRNYPLGDRTFGEFLANVKERMLKAFENQEYSFEELVDKLAVKRDIGRNPLFDIMFALHNMNTGLESRDIQTEIETGPPFQPDSQEKYENIFRTAKFDLTLSALERDRGLFLSFQYCTKLFKKETIERFIIYFKKIVTIVVKEPGIRLSEIEVISGEEKNRLLYELNDSEADYPKDKTIFQVFEEQVERTPGHIAIIGPGLGVGTRFIASGPGKQNIHLSYRQLNKASNQLARVLRGKGVKPETIVGIMVERSAEMIVGIMGILKSGGAYLPMDPDYPQERIEYMLKDSGAKLSVTDNDLKKLPDFPASQLPNFRPSPAASFAYVIYTSGSTGKPKGVMIEHRPLINFIKGITDVIPFTTNDCILSLTTFSFDIFWLETILPITKGSKVIIGDKEEQLDTEKTALAIEREHITVFQVVPTRLKMIISDRESSPSLKRLKYLLVGGEEFPQALLEGVKKAAQGKIYNVYGPTETTIWSTIRDLTEEKVIDIGKPIANTQVFLLNNNGYLQPMGVVGELCLGGDGLARGYLNQPGLTAEKFIFFDRQLHKIQEPARITNTNTIYKTGDLARWLPDGNIEFLGRIDHQVKIRGFRIELEEIESRLARYPGIEEVVVICKNSENSDNYLCAYIVSGHEIPVSILKEHLSEQLPDYMSPSYFVRIEKIPVTPNGKVNRKALPEPELKVGDSFIAPRNEIEKQLVELWSEILGRNELHTSQLKASIGIADNFFELGGHSLKATILLSRIHKGLNVKIPLAEIFKTPTIKGLAKTINRLEKNKFVSIEPVEEKEYYRLSAAQKRLYFVYLMEPNSVAYNLPMFFVLKGDLDKDLLTETFRKLLARHDSLRTSYMTIGEAAVQRIQDNIDFKIDYKDAENLEENTRKFTADFIRPFDLSKAPLFRVGLVKENEKRHILMLDIHHIITDGISQNVLDRDFISHYTKRELPPLKLQYKDFSEWEYRLYDSGNIKKQAGYWLNRFKDGIPVLNLPTDFPRPAVFSSDEGDVYYFRIDREQTARLNEMLFETGTSMYMFLLAVFNVLLSKYCRQEDIVVGSPVAGRRHSDLEEIIGMFINMLSMRNRPEADKTFIEFLYEVKDNALNAYNNQDYQFEELVKKLGLHGTSDRNPLFSTVFSDMNLEKSLTDKRESIMTNKLGIRMERSKFVETTSKFDLRFAASYDFGEIKISITYSTNLFKLITMEKMAKRFLEILRQVLDKLDIKLKDIGISHDMTITTSDTFQDYQEDFEF